MEPVRDVSLGKGGGGWAGLTSLTHWGGEGRKEQGEAFVPEPLPLLLSCSQQSCSFPPASGGAPPLPGAPPRIQAHRVPSSHGTSFLSPPNRQVGCNDGIPF